LIAQQLADIMTTSSRIDPLHPATLLDTQSHSCSELHWPRSNCRHWIFHKSTKWKVTCVPSYWLMCSRDQGFDLWLELNSP